VGLITTHWEIRLAIVGKRLWGLTPGSRSSRKNVGKTGVHDRFWGERKESIPYLSSGGGALLTFLALGGLSVGAGMAIP